MRRERLQDVVAEHLMPALEGFEIDQDGLADLLGEQWSGVLWGFGFEDFLGQRYEDGNIVDLYLKRRGWKETALNKANFAALRDAPVSLYEVSDVQPGTSMVLRDLLSDAAPVTVREKSGTRTLKQWDRIAVRVVAERDHHVISGALLPFRAEAVDFLFAGLRDALKLKKRDALRLSHDQLMGCAPRRDAQPGEALAALDHSPHSRRLQLIEIRQPARIGMIGPAQPQHLQPFAHGPVRMSGLRLDPRADDIAHQTVHSRRDPWVVPRIPSGPPCRRGRAREDGRVQSINRPRALPTPPATRGVKAASAREAEKAMDEGPHGRQNRPKWTLKLLGMFGSQRLATPGRFAR